MKLKPSSACDECNELEFIEHMLHTCVTLRTFWETIEHKLTIIIGQNIKISTAQALFGIAKNDIDTSMTKINEANHLLLIAKWCITKHRLTKPSDLSSLFEHELLLRTKYFTSFRNTDN